MFANSYFAGPYYSDSYFPPLEVVDIPPPVAGGGGSSAGVGYSHYNQAPDTREYKPKLLLKQAMQEDEEMLLMIKAFVETIQ